MRTAIRLFTTHRTRFRWKIVCTINACPARARPHQASRGVQHMPEAAIIPGDVTTRIARPRYLSLYGDRQRGTRRAQSDSPRFVSPSRLVQYWHRCGRGRLIDAREGRPRTVLSGIIRFRARGGFSSLAEQILRPKTTANWVVALKPSRGVVSILQPRMFKTQV